MELTTADKIEANGRTVFTFYGIEGLDPRMLKGQTVHINGLPHLVTGVETYAIFDATGTNFGLVVEPSAPAQSAGPAYD